MGNHKAITGGRKLAGGVLVGAAASGVLAVGALSGAGTANATCASISGIGNSADCTSTFGSFSAALGPNTQAHSSGIGTVALAVGGNSAGTGSLADSTGAFSVAYAGGGARARTGGILNLAVGQGGFSNVQSGNPGSGDIGNVAVSVGPANSIVDAGGTEAQVGFGNLAVSLFGTQQANSVDRVQAVGGLNSALNFGGAKNVILVGGLLNNGTQVGGNSNFIFVGNNPGTGLLPRPGLNVGFSAFGSRNEVNSGLPAGGNGPLAIAGALFGSDLHFPTPVNRAGFGVNINNRINFPNEAP